MVAVAKVKKRNPNDATLRNIRAVKKRVLHLEERVKILERAVKLLARPSRSIW